MNNIQENYESNSNFLKSVGWNVSSELLFDDDRNNICESIKFENVERSTGKFTILKIKFPKDTKITITTKHKFTLYATDKIGEEIPNDTKIRIYKQKYDDNDTSNIAKVYYSDVKSDDKNFFGYNFVGNYSITSEYYFCVQIKDIEVLKEDILFSLTFDYWTKGNPNKLKMSLRKYKKEMTNIISKLGI